MINFRNTARLAGYVGVCLIIVLSLLPGRERPHTGASGQMEHIAAYFLTMLCLAAGHPRWRQQAIMVFGLALCSAIMEVAQIYIPGRSPAVGDALASSGGAIIALATYFWMARVYKRLVHARSRPSNSSV
jgi:VanZ family protein